MKSYSVVKKSLFVFLVVIFMALAIALATLPGLEAFASEEKIAFEKGDVKAELVQMGFNLNDYPKDTNGSVTVFTFMEYGYSEYVNVIDDYGLYFYIYNPTEVIYDFDSNKNCVELGISYAENGTCNDYSKFQLALVSSAENGRFLKLKVSAGLETIHDIVLGSERRYDISGIELLKKGKLNAEEYSVATTFYYSGFAKGFARNPEAESTLSCRTVTLDTIELEVKHTTYKAWNTDNVSGQELATVYFNVPDRYFDEYGALQTIKAEWLYSFTDYIFCTWYEDLYNKLLPFVGQEIIYEDSLPYYFYSSMSSSQDGYQMYWYDAYNIRENSINSHVISRIPTINWLMPKYLNSSEELLEYIQNSNNKEKLFSHVDSEKTVKVIDAGDSFDLKGLDSNHSGWEWLWEYLGFTNTIEKIVPIYVLTDLDASLSNEEFAAQLKVNERDVDDIKRKHSEDGSRTVLFRFAVNPFETQDLIVAASNYKPDGFSAGSREYLYRTKIPLYQDFDIIWLGFQKNGLLTIVPAVSNPTTVIGSTEPPIDNDDKDWSGEALMESVLGENWKDGCEEANRTILIVLMVLFCSVILYFIVRFIIWLKPKRVKVKVKQSKSKKMKSVKPPRV